MSESRDRALEARRLVIEAAAASKTSHMGSSMSVVDALAVLYADVLRPDDHFLLSKGHAAGALYATLVTAGVLGRDEFLDGYCGDGGVFPGHPERGLPGIEMTGGSLGHGPAIAVGMALGSSGRVFCLVGDGELNEGSVWEAIALAGHRRIARLILIVDANGFQALGRTSEVLDMGSLNEKFSSFDWDAVDVDGHDHDALRRELGAVSDRPRVLIAHTVKGKGVDFMEDELMWHYRSFKDGEREAALEALERGAA